jgi:hypothetical protein
LWWELAELADLEGSPAMVAMEQQVAHRLLPRSLARFFPSEEGVDKVEKLERLPSEEVEGTEDPVTTEEAGEEEGKENYLLILGQGVRAVPEPTRMEKTGRVPRPLCLETLSRTAERVLRLFRHSHLYQTGETEFYWIFLQAEAVGRLFGAKASQETAVQTQTSRLGVAPVMDFLQRGMDTAEAEDLGFRALVEFFHVRKEQMEETGHLDLFAYLYFSKKK